MNENKWKFKTHWRIEGFLTTISGLHLGDGETTTNPELDSGNGLIEVNSVAMDVDGKPCIPGSSLKGSLRAWVEKHAYNEKLPIDLLFGKEPLQKSGAGEIEDVDQGMGGKAEFFDARVEFPRGDLESCLPYWNSDRQTYVETSVAIDRVTQTALDKHLVHNEIVPPGVTFKVVVTGPLGDEEENVALLLAAMQGFNDPLESVTIGANTASGYGCMRWELDSINTFGVSEAVAWLAQTDKPMMFDAMRLVTPAERNRMVKLGQKMIKKSRSFEKYCDICIKFDGPFLVNDPPTKTEREKKKTVKESVDEPSQIPDHKPLRDVLGHPSLPSKSLRGALRAQAERIVRTLGEHCCNPINPCEPIYHKQDLKNLCSVCRLFGAPGWKTPLQVTNFEFVAGSAADLHQDFVAIDRFTGGAKDQAKFDANYIYAPSYAGTLNLDENRLEEKFAKEAKGLLALVLRDLQDGDICLGFGRAKGYGTCRADIGGLDPSQSEENITAFLGSIPSEEKPGSEHTAGFSTCAETTLSKKVANHSETTENRFHNPYHFIPIVKPDTSNWLPREALETHRQTKRTPDHHTHDRYFDGIGDKKVYNGRILCRIETTTPVVFGGERIPTTKPQETKPFLLGGEPAIPATTLRGMLSALVETASCSSLRVLENMYLTVRANYKKPLKQIGILVWYGNTLKLLPMQKDDAKKLHLNRPIIIDGVEKSLKKYAFSKNFDNFYFMNPDTKPNEPLAFSSNNVEGWVKGKFHVMAGSIRDFPGGKHNEYFYEIPKNAHEDMLLDAEDAIKCFEDMADRCTKTQNNEKLLRDYEYLPFHPIGTKRNLNSSKYGRKIRLKEGDLVFFDAHKKNVTALSISSIWREQKGRVWDFFRKIDPELLPFNPKRQKVSPAELLFGFVEEKLSGKEGGNDKLSLAFAGKVGVSFGYLAPEYLHDDSLFLEPVTLKVLATPKPPSPALYFKGSGGYVAKNSLSPVFLPQGRKYYLHGKRGKDGRITKLNQNGNPGNDDKARYPWESHADASNDDRANLKAKVWPIREKTVFYFNLDFDNLSEEELSLLCYALKPNDSFEHKIGMGKPLGLGSISIDPVGLYLIDRTRRYNSTEARARYHALWQKRHESDSLPVLYDQEAALTDEGDPVLNPRDFAEKYRNKMNPDVAEAIRILGDPKAVTVPVHYPQVQGQNIEEKTFRWFVANDTKIGPKNDEIGPQESFLTPLTEHSRKLPMLKRHIWKE